MSAPTAGRPGPVTRPDGVTVLPACAEDTTSGAREALRDLAVLAHDTGRRSWAVVGPVAGAGPEEHDALGRLAVRLNVGRLVALGDAAGAVHAGAVLEGSWGEESVHAPDAASAAAHLAAELRPGDLVLLVGPRAEALRPALLARDDDPGSPA